MKLVYSRDEMTRLCIEALESRGVTVDDIANIAYEQQSKYTPDIKMETCRDSVLKLLSLRDIFHTVLLGVELDKMAEKKMFEGPIQDIIEQDLGLFGIDEVLGFRYRKNLWNYWVPLTLAILMLINAESFQS